MQDPNAAQHRELRSNRPLARRNSAGQPRVLRQPSTHAASTEHGLSSAGQAARARSRPTSTEYPMSKRPTERVEEFEEIESERSSRPPAEVSPVFAANLEHLREKRGLSLAQLADTSGLSLTQLEQLSSGKHEPNIKTLWSLANALGVPFRALIAEETRSESETLRSAQVSSRKVLASRDGGRNSEVYEIKLAARAGETAEARRAGAVENVLVTKGSAEVRAGALHYTLHEGESVSFRADQARHYGSLGEAAATLYIVISQPVE